MQSVCVRCWSGRGERCNASLCFVVVLFRRRKKKSCNFSFEIQFFKKSKCRCFMLRRKTEKNYFNLTMRRTLFLFFGCIDQDIQCAFDLTAQDVRKELAFWHVPFALTFFMLHIPPCLPASWEREKEKPENNKRRKMFLCTHKLHENYSSQLTFSSSSLAGLWHNVCIFRTGVDVSKKEVRTAAAGNSYSIRFVRGEDEHLV